ncbi:MAG: DUF1573 domain-containing protein [FCB group bacterium]|jgi:hypothetical protein
MVRGLIFTAVFILMIMAIANAQPKLEIVGGDSYDWKKVSSKQDSLKTELKIKNSGNQKLIISEVKPACGCTTAEIDKKELEPGDIATLPITVRITGAHGRFSKTIKITSNDPVNKEKIINLNANIFYPIDIIPGQFLSFGEMEIGKESTTSVIIKNNTQLPVTFFGFTVTPPDLISISAKGDIVLKPGEEFELSAKSTPVQSGTFNGSINIKSTNTDYSEIIIKCFGMVK